MTLGDILMGLLVATGFFASAAVSRMFRRGATGIIIGGVAGIAVSVTVLIYGLDELLGLPARDGDGGYFLLGTAD